MDTSSAEALIDETLRLAISCQEAARTVEADALFRSILSVQPRHAEANHRLGKLLMQAGETDSALEYLTNACAVAPETGRYWIGIADCLIRLTRCEEARQVLETAMRAGLSDPQAHLLLERALAPPSTIPPKDQAPSAPVSAAPPCPVQSGPDSPAELRALVKRSVQRATLRRKYVQQPAILPHLARILDAGDWPALKEAAWQELEGDPLYGKAWDLLGMAYLQLDRSDSALIALSRANVLLPKDMEVWDHLGVAQRLEHQYGEAERSFKQSLALQPLRHETWINLGNLQLDQGKPDSAIASFQHALKIRPESVEALSNLGMAQMDKGQVDEAIVCYRRVLEIAPELAETHNNLGLALREQDKLSEALQHFESAVTHKPRLAKAHSSLGSLLQQFGQGDQAIVHHRQALAIKPDWMAAQGSLIFALDLSGRVDTASLQEERKKWDRQHAAPLFQNKAHANTAEPERRLRIGYVSADFRSHSAAFVFGAMLVHFDRARFDVIAYSNIEDDDGDELNKLFRQQVTLWRNIVHQSDDAVADLIRQDQVDILVDLSGHSSGNRLLVFARKPAPVQITAWGYATSTGMRAMDIFFADPVLVPPEERHLYTEEIRDLPNAVSAFNPSRFPESGNLPAGAGQGITFGSFNRLAKTSDEVFEVWARILSTVPGSRLFFKAVELDEAIARDRVTQFFTERGIVPERLLFQGKSAWTEHLLAYNRVDIALDPFPHCGGVTTLESLKMSVPVITLRRPTIAGRLSASILTTLGLTDWIAESPEQYVAIAARKAADLASLASLRKNLRTLFEASVIGNPQAYVQAVEKEYRQIWREWCARQRNVKTQKSAQLGRPT